MGTDWTNKAKPLTPEPFEAARRAILRFKAGIEKVDMYPYAKHREHLERYLFKPLFEQIVKKYYHKRIIEILERLKNEKSM